MFALNDHDFQAQLHHSDSCLLLLPLVTSLAAAPHCADELLHLGSNMEKTAILRGFDLLLSMEKTTENHILPVIVLVIP